MVQINILKKTYIEVFAGEYEVGDSGNSSFSELVHK